MLNKNHYYDIWKSFDDLIIYFSKFRKYITEEKHITDKHSIEGKYNYFFNPCLTFLIKYLVNSF